MAKHPFPGAGAFLGGLKCMMQEAARIAMEKGFRSPEGRVEIEIARMHQELSHVLDTFSKRNPKSRYIEYTRRDEAAANLAIRLLDFCERYHIPLGEAILAKMDHNESRPRRGEKGEKEI